MAKRKKKQASTQRKNIHLSKFTYPLNKPEHYDPVDSSNNSEFNMPRL